MTLHTICGRLQRIGFIVALVFPLLTACGGGSSMGGSSTSVEVPVPAVSVSLFAGNPLGEGNQDGPTSTTASFGRTVGGMAMTSSGEVVIADTQNNLIRKLSANYETVSTLAGSRVFLSAASGTPTSYSDGNGPDARFNGPAGVAVDTAGNTYVADSGNHLVRKISPAGAVTTLAGQPGKCGNQDGVGNAATLCNPISIAVSKTGIAFVLDGSEKRRVRKITPEGVVSTLDGDFSSIQAIATDSAGTLYVAEVMRILRYGTNGQSTVVLERQLVGDEVISRIISLSFDSADRLFVVSESIGFALLGFDSTISVGRIDSAGLETNLFKQGCGFGRFQVTPMVAKGDGQLLVALRGCSYEQPYLQLRSYTQQGTYTVVTGHGTQDGQGDAVRFDQPSALAVNPAGTLYVRDYVQTSRSAVIRTVQADGRVHTLGRPGGPCISLTGHSDEFERIMQNQGLIAVDGVGSVYHAQGGRILKVRDCKVELLVNNLDAFFLSNSSLTGLVADTSGNIFVATSGGVILKIDANAKPTLLAGSADQYGHKDGQGQAARFAVLGNMTIDAAGNLYVIDGPPPFSIPAGKDVPTLGPAIRKITPDGLVSTLAGNPNAAPGHADGRGANARFSMHYNGLLRASLAVDKTGNLFVSDPEYRAIRKVTPDGRVSTPVRQGFATALVPFPSHFTKPDLIDRPASIAIHDSKLFIAVPHALLLAKLPD